MYFTKKLQHNANIPQGGHFLFSFLIMVVQINKINLTLTSNLTLTLFPHTNHIPNPKPNPNSNPKRSRQKCEKQLRNIIVSLLKYIILLKSGYRILDQHPVLQLQSLQMTKISVYT